MVVKVQLWQYNIDEFQSGATLENFIDIFLHLDTHLNHWVAILGLWSYALLFLIIFCETGLIVTPFLPGDSLLFAVGALCATENAALNIFVVAISLTVAAILGDAVNYSVGRKIGPTVFTQNRKWLNKDHLLKAHAFYEKHGGKTIILARFLPIIRTFAPFVAGVAQMSYSRFSLFNITGALIWVISILFCGYFLGSIPFVKEHFEVIVIGLILLPGLPAAYQIISHQLATRKLKAKNN